MVLGKPNRCITLYIKINSKWIKNLNSSKTSSQKTWGKHEVSPDQNMNHVCWWIYMWISWYNLGNTFCPLWVLTNKTGQCHFKFSRWEGTMCYTRSSLLWPPFFALPRAIWNDTRFLGKGSTLVLKSYAPHPCAANSLTPPCQLAWPSSRGK